MNKYDNNELLNCFKMTVDLEGIKKLEEYITTLVKLQEENKRLKQWVCNKDSRNSRQRVANAKLIKENKILHNKIDKAIEYIKRYVFMDLPQLIKLVEILKDSDYNA